MEMICRLSVSAHERRCKIWFSTGEFSGRLFVNVVQLRSIMSEPIFSPDGKWMWSGSEWVPAPPSTESPQSSDLVVQDSAVAGDINVTQQTNIQHSADAEVVKAAIEAVMTNSHKIQTDSEVLGQKQDDNVLFGWSITTEGEPVMINPTREQIIGYAKEMFSAEIIEKVDRGRGTARPGEAIAMEITIPGSYFENETDEAYLSICVWDKEYYEVNSHLDLQVISQGYIEFMARGFPLKNVEIKYWKKGFFGGVKTIIQTFESIIVEGDMRTNEISVVWDLINHITNCNFSILSNYRWDMGEAW